MSEQQVFLSCCLVTPSHLVWLSHCQYYSPIPVLLHLLLCQHCRAIATWIHSFRHTRSCSTRPVYVRWFWGLQPAKSIPTIRGSGEHLASGLVCAFGSVLFLVCDIWGVEMEFFQDKSAAPFWHPMYVNPAVSQSPGLTKAGRQISIQFSHRRNFRNKCW